MEKWFDSKFEKKRLRRYTYRRLKKEKFKFFRRLSMTSWIIISNFVIFVFLLLSIQIFKSEKILEIFALQANNFFNGKYWTVLTSMFMHFGLWHLAANMISLFFIGNFIERLIGRKRLFWLYILSGIFAGFFYVFFSYYFGINEISGRIFGKPSDFAVGASGAIFSLLGLLAILTPKNKVYLIAGPIFALVFQAFFGNYFGSSSFISAVDLAVTLYILFSILAIFSLNPRIIKFAIPVKMSFWILPIVAIFPLVLIGLFVPLPIGNSAHFGGLLMGILYGIYLRKKYKKKIELINRVFSG